MTRHLYAKIHVSPTWDSLFRFDNCIAARNELQFWDNKFDDLTCKPIRPTCIQDTIVCFSDASNSALGIILDGKKCHTNLSPTQQLKSSTWWELKAVEYGLQVFSNELSNKSLEWYTDSYAASMIVKKGSPIRELQQLAIGIYNLSHTLNTTLNLRWVPREENKAADKLSKFVDPDDWKITDDFVTRLQK